MRSLYTPNKIKRYADPELRLLAAVALTAIDDLRRKKPKPAAAARAWLAGADAPISFEMVALAIGEDDTELSDRIAVYWEL